MIGLFIALAMVLGVGGTVAVSDNARPGDVLFKVDRAVENARISLAKKENKNELRLRFAEERVKEVEELKEESKTVNDATESLSDEDEADVALGIENALELLTDIDNNAEIADERLEKLAALLSAYLETLPADARVQVSDDRLRIKFDQGPEKIEVKDQGENKAKIDVRTEEGRLRIEVKDGEIEIKTKTEGDDDGDEDKNGELEVEAEILSDKTIVEVEFNDEKTTFATSADTEAGIIAAVLAKFPNLTEAQVKAVLEIETEDSDEDDDSDDASDDDEDDSDDDDDDSDDDNSGSNSDSGR